MLHEVNLYITRIRLKKIIYQVINQVSILTIHCQQSIFRSKSLGRASREKRGRNVPAPFWLNQQLTNEAEQHMKNYGMSEGFTRHVFSYNFAQFLLLKRVTCPPFFFPQPSPQVFSVNAALTCSCAALLTSSVN